MSAAPVRFLFDFISPNAYLAWERIHDLAARHRRAVEPEPVLFAGLLNAHGAIGPAEIRPKWAWMLRDILRKSADHGIPLAPPRSHPFNPLLALRVTTLPMDDAARRRVITAIFRAAWAEGADITDPGVVSAAVTSVGLDGPSAIENAAGEANKRNLRRRTERAAEQGVFGVPTMLVDDRLFWGFDDFVPLERHLAGDDPAIEAAELERWEAIRPSADRRG